MRSVVLIVIGVAALAWVIQQGIAQMDVPVTGVRPGIERLMLYVDPLTGCHYLSVGTHGLTPRMQADGKQKGCRS